jgi:hypothetical protein
MALQGPMNKVIRGMLHVPGVSKGMGGSLLTVYVTGRKSGRQYSVPVAYTRHDGALLIGTPFAWGRNLRTGEPVEILLQGRRRTADVEVYSGEPEVTKAYTVLCKDKKTFANFNKISFGANGEPNAEDLHAAWAAGARAFRLTLR